MKVDTFESVFRSAVKERFEFDRPTLRKALLVTDVSAEETAKIAAQASVLLPGDDVEIVSLAGPSFHGVREMLAQIEQIRPDLLISYRCIGRANDLPFTLGAHLDTLTQAVSAPVIVLPPPEAMQLRPPKRVMVVADHLTGDNRLVSWGAQFCEPNGRLYLAHVEDGATFARYADAIGKIPDLDTDETIDRLRKKLLQMPTEYIATISGALAQQSIHENVESVVTMGHALADYKRLIDEHELDLLVLHGKDDRQLAMNGVAYALAVEIRHIPLLLI